MSNNFALFTVLLFYSLPLVNFQSYRDIKTDLGLLFILLSILLILVNYLTSIYPVEYAVLSFEKEQTKNIKPSIEQVEKKAIITRLIGQEYSFLLLLGLLSGLALGIKLTALILIFSIVAILFYVKAGQIGLLTSVFLTFLVILLGNLDVESGLRAYHFGADKLRFVVLGVGLAGLVFMFYRNSKQSFHLIKICTVYTLFSILTYLPWPIKHYKETNVLSFQTIIQGKSIEPAYVQ